MKLEVDIEDAERFALAVLKDAAKELTICIERSAEKLDKGTHHAQDLMDSVESLQAMAKVMYYFGGGEWDYRGDKLRELFE